MIQKEDIEVNKGIHGGDYNRRYNPELPAVYSIAYELHQSSLQDSGVSGTGSFVVGNIANYGDVEVFTDSD